MLMVSYTLLPSFREILVYLDLGVSSCRSRCVRVVHYICPQLCEEALASGIVSRSSLASHASSSRLKASSLPISDDSHRRRNWTDSFNESDHLYSFPNVHQDDDESYGYGCDEFRVHRESERFWTGWVGRTSQVWVCWIETTRGPSFTPSSLLSLSTSPTL